jgi:hypothetical protein
MSMAIAGPALCNHDFCEFANAQRRPASLKSLAPKFQMICAIFCALLAAGCARNPAYCEFDAAVHEVKATPVGGTERTRRYSEKYDTKPRIRRPNPAMLAPQPPPDCEFKRSDLTPVDPDEFARLKSDYERQCYQKAEQAARNRLSLLQASSTHEIESIRQPRVVGQPRE